MLVHNRNGTYLLALLYHVSKEAHVSAGVIGGDRRAAKHPFETAACDVECRRFTDHEWNGVTLRNGSRREAARRLIGAHQHIDFVLGDQAGRELLRQRRIALMIDEHKLELRPTHIRQACSLGEGEFRSEEHTS